MLLNNIINPFSLCGLTKLVSTAGVTISHGNTGVGFEKSTGAQRYNNTGTQDTAGGGCALCTVGVVIGKDTTPPQRTDYQMTEPIIEGYSWHSNLIKQDATVGALMSMTNTSEENIIINSVGLFGSQFNEVPLEPSRIRFLFTKTLLEQPLIIKPSETKTITITIDFNKMLDSVNNA